MSTCPNILSNGTCLDEACSHRHDVITCEVCELVFANVKEHNEHFASKKHRQRASGKGITVFCRICSVNVDVSLWNEHLVGRRHRKEATRQAVSPDTVAPQPAVSTAGKVACDLCRNVVEDNYWEQHIATSKHRSRMAFTNYKTALDNAESDKYGVVIEGLSGLDYVEPPVAQVGVRWELSIRTTSPDSQCKMVEMKLGSSQSVRAVTSGFSLPIDAMEPCQLTADPIKISVSFKQPHLGRYEDRLELVFEENQLGRKFMIVRVLKVIVGNKAEHEELKPKAPFVPRNHSTREVSGAVVAGVKPPALDAIPYVSRFSSSDSIPVRLSEIMAGSETVRRVVGRVRAELLPASLNRNTHGKYFKHLIWIEEMKMAQDLERYDIPNAKLSRQNQDYYLDVPGLAEKRPSVLVGDIILVQEANQPNSKWYEGHVHFVRQTDVGLRFSKSFDKIQKDCRFYVRFKLNRVPLRRQHQALAMSFLEDRILFPRPSHLPGGAFSTQATFPLKLYNPLIKANEAQLQAVVSIVSNPPGSLPFVVFGPPGTGKTVTIVEAIQQVLAANPSAKILACAPSNSAADIIASRLKARLTTHELFRFYAPSRSKRQVPDELLPYTYIQPSGHFSVPRPAKDRLRQFKVIVTTCVSASIGHGIGISRGHFSHIFIDEAGQATEPEALVSVKTMYDAKTNIILSGDPKQLGPVIRSAVASQLGLEKSYLERLMDSEAYDLRGGYGKSVVKLVRNFRSHNEILKYPNERFYDNELKACAKPVIMNKYLKWTSLPTQKFPIIFHSVSGKDDREASSPSFFNIDEILQVVSYIKQLKADPRIKTTDADIGVITPYHAQCMRLKNKLSKEAKGIKVGSVEEFQGQERPVIIISTVRSSKDFIEYDVRHTLGFVANPRRFNVAVTRAQALLIIVGDPQVLSLDPLWRKFLNHIYVNGGWTGPDITWDPHVAVRDAGGYDEEIQNEASLDMNNFARRIEEMTIGEEADGAVDMQWRNDE